jgi:SAM-dependent methyltransferase
VLDIGCGFGWALGNVPQIPRRVGIDMDMAALEDAAASYPDIEFVQQSGTSIGFPDREFGAVVLSDVLEHVARSDQASVVAEARRVLRDGGLLILTVPHAGVTAFLDPLDIKRRFPMAYNFYCRLSAHIPQTAPEIGHQHLTMERLDKLLSPHFEMTSIEFGGFLEPLLIVAVHLMEFARLPKGVTERANRFRAFEGGIHYPRHLAYNVYFTARARSG